MVNNPEPRARTMDNQVTFYSVNFRFYSLLEFTIEGDMQRVKPLQHWQQKI